MTELHSSVSPLLPRVAYLVHSAAPSGAELALLRAAELWADDLNLTVVFGSSGPMVERFSAAGIRTLVEPLPGTAVSMRRQSGARSKVAAVVILLTYAIRLRRVLRRGAYNLIVAGSLKSVIYGRLASFGLGVRFVWSCHDRISREYLGPAAVIYARLLPRIVDGVVANSRSTLDTLRIGSRPALICPPGVALVGGTQGPRPVHAEIRQVAILGRLTPWKGQAEGLRAFAAAEQPQLALHIVGGALFGEDDYAEILRQLATSLGIADRVTFHGHVDGASDLLDEVDLLLHTSVIPEPFGAVVVEGMAHGCVVVATRPGGPAEVIADGRNGFLVSAGDVSAMAAAIRRVVALPESERIKIVSAGYDTAQRFSNEIVASARGRWLAAVARGTAPSGVTDWRQLSGGVAAR